MDKSRTRGKTLSETGEGDSKLLETLSTLSTTPLITRIEQALGPEGQLHVVGGTVRDFASGKRACDIDLATPLHPDEVEAKLVSAEIRVVKTGIEHGTLTAVVDGNNIEITTFRKPGSRTESDYSKTIEEDLSGRDFTINAIAYSLAKKALIDPHHGLPDLRSGLLRAVGSATDRFKEDPLRILRMVRLGPADGRTVDEETQNSASKLRTLLEGVSIERIRTELEKILVSEHPSAGLRSLQALELLEYTIPELLPAVGFEQNDFHVEDVFDHILSVVDRAPQNLLLRLSALFHDMGKPHTLSVGEDGRRHFFNHEAISEEITKKVMTRLRFSKELTKSVALLVSLHMRPLSCGPTAVRRLMRELEDHLSDWLALKVADAAPTMPEEEFNEMLTHFTTLLEKEILRQKESPYGKLAVNGHDLIVLGLSPGRFLGQVLGELEEIVIEDPSLNDKEVLLKRAKDIILSEG